MTNLDFNLHTMIILVGPSGCGKTHFAVHTLKPQLEQQLKDKGITPNVQYISSDVQRKLVLGNYEIHKHNPEMMFASKPAFELLHKKIDLATVHPTLAHFTIVDTTGLSKDFRDQLIQQAKTNKYNTACVIFDYKKNDEYFKYNEQDPDYKKWVTAKHIERFRKHFWKDFKKKDFHKMHKIKSKDFSELNIQINDLDLYTKTQIDPDFTYDVISDVHGCRDEFVALVEKLGYKVENGIITVGPESFRKIIFAGDIVDRGYDSKATLKFILDNQYFIIPVMGNHESFVIKWHKGLLKNINMEDDFRAKWFDCSLSEDQEFIDMLMKYDEIALPFAQNYSMIVTHGPSENKYLGKIDKISQKNQMKGKRGREDYWDLSEEDRVQANRDHYQYIKEEADRSYPLHVFGHVSQQNAFKIKNKICIDTGCPQGGKLTAVTITPNNKTEFNSVTATHHDSEQEKLYDLFPVEKHEFNLDSLEPRERGRIHYSTEDKINFISGTMSPSQADVENNEIEPIETALEYYKKNGIDEIVLQPKYMGSRCTVYLYKDLDKCYATSRKGYKIKEDRVNMKPILERLQKEYLDDNDYVILDGELMPWHTLGEELIEETFKVVAAGIESELNELNDCGFQKELDKLYCDDNYKTYLVESIKGSKKEMQDKYGQHNVRTYENLAKYTHHSIEEQYEGLKTYKEQINIFGQSGEIDFYPFMLLKKCKNGEEVLGYDNALEFNWLRPNELCRVINLNDSNYLEKAKDFYNKVAAKKLEGVVVKPRFVNETVAPAIKVRTREYLHIVYGYDFLFDTKYDRLLKQKRIGRKLKTSIKEFQIGMELLKIRQDEVNHDNIKYKKLIANMIAEEKKEQNFDPRL